MKKRERDALIEGLADSMILILMQMGNACSGDGTDRAASFWGQAAYMIGLVHGEEAKDTFLDQASGGHYSSYMTLRQIGFDHAEAHGILSGQVMEEGDSDE